MLHVRFTSSVEEYYFELSEETRNTYIQIIDVVICGLIKADLTISLIGEKDYVLVLSLKNNRKKIKFFSPFNPELIPFDLCIMNVLFFLDIIACTLNLYLQ